MPFCLYAGVDNCIGASDITQDMVWPNGSYISFAFSVRLARVIGMGQLVPFGIRQLPEFVAWARGEIGWQPVQS